MGIFLGWGTVPDVPSGILPSHPHPPHLLHHLLPLAAVEGGFLQRISPEVTSRVCAHYFPHHTKSTAAKFTFLFRVKFALLSGCFAKSLCRSSHCNLGFTMEAPTYDGARSEEGSEKLSQEMGKSGPYTENLQLHSSSGVEAVTKEEQILSAEFECPICLDLMLPPRKIFQCIRGHPTCSWCLSQGLTFCPTCRGPFMGRARNMERIAAILLENSVEVSAD